MSLQTELERSLRHIKIILMIFLGIATLYLMRELSNLLVPLFFALFFAVLFQQRNVVRIILLVPVYSLALIFSLKYHDQALYYATVRDVYEAFVIYWYSMPL